MRTVAFCEIDPYCRAVLRKHWPGVQVFENVCDLHAYDTGPVDVICGGFPCQDISLAGKGAGLAGERSGLWSEYRRLIGELRPSWAIVENVGALRSRGLEAVLGELAALGYDAEWHCIPASAVGARHRRDRVWIVAYPQPAGSPDAQGREGQAESPRRQILTPDIFGPGVHGWLPEPEVGRVVHGLQADVDAVGALGNSVVPEIPYRIGQAILEAESVCVR